MLEMSLGFKICGVVCHEIDPLLPPPDENPVPKLAQLYIYDAKNELDQQY
jgi:hypothetical protein